MRHANGRRRSAQRKQRKQCGLPMGAAAMHNKDTVKQCGMPTGAAVVHNESKRVEAAAAVEACSAAGLAPCEELAVRTSNTVLPFPLKRRAHVEWLLTLPS